MLTRLLLIAQQRVNEAEIVVGGGVFRIELQRSLEPSLCFVQQFVTRFEPFGAALGFGAPDRIRTCDPCLRSTLFQL